MDTVLVAGDYSMKRFEIYIKRGVYKENVETKNKKNLMMLGDGIDATIISGNRNFMDGWTTFRSATFDLFAGLVWNVAGYVVGIRVLLENGGLLGMGWSVAECLHWSVGVWLLEYSHYKRVLLLEVKA